MAGIPPAERDQRAAEVSRGISNNTLSKYLHLKQEHNLPDELDWEDGLEKRRLFYLHASAVMVDRYLTEKVKELEEFPGNCKTALLTGKAGIYAAVSYFVIFSQEMIPRYREPVSRLVTEIQDIMREKGFLHGGALLTSREHEEVGSSGHGGIYKEVDPDIPIPLLRQRLIAEGRLEPDPYDKTTYTVEGIGKARRLAGKTSLDPETGRVTGQKDEEAAHDSYFFLPPERKTQVMAREEEILAEVEEIARKAREEHEKSVDILPALDAYSRGEQPFVEVREVFKAVLARLSDRDSLNLDDPIKELRKIAFATGRWDHILTPQEILLRTGSEIDARYLTRPYTPLAVQDGESVQKIARLRQGEESMVVTTALLEYERPFGFRLEELDETGQTVKSPTFLENEFGGEEMSEESKAFLQGRIGNFPFARPEDWHYNE